MQSASVDSPRQMQAPRRRTWTCCGVASRASPCGRRAAGWASPCVSSVMIRGRRLRRGRAHRSRHPAHSQRVSALVTVLRSSASVGSLATATVTATTVTAPVTVPVMALPTHPSSAGAAVPLWASSLTSCEAGLLAGRVAGSCRCGDGAFLTAGRAFFQREAGKRSSECVRPWGGRRGRKRPNPFPMIDR